jgi:hypothetical protein
MPTKESIIRGCNMIMSDADKDMRELDGKELTGELIGTTLGNIYASINALALIIKTMVSEDFKLESEKS